MNQAIEQSTKEKVKAIAQKQGRTFNDVWQEVVLERWLARLASSPYRKHFIFKGAMCLMRYIDLQRETRDLDFLIKDLDATVEDIQKYLTEVSNHQLADGFNFENLAVGPLPHAHMKYPGYQISVVGRLGGTKTKVFIDIGVGDAVRPTEITITLLATEKSPLFEKEINLWAYPIESIFAEKLETAIVRAEQNSRMKDYHDLIALVRGNVIDLDKLNSAINKTFHNRETQIQRLTIADNQIKHIQEYWNLYKRSLKSEVRSELDSDLQNIIKEINLFLDLR